MRLVLAFLSVLALSACLTPTPEDTLGVDAAKATDADAASADGEEVAAADGTTDPVEVAVVINNDNPTISDTQDFGALTERVTIEDDKALLKAQRDKFQLIEPTALPSRGKQVNVAAFALQATNNVGEKIYSRINPFGKAVAKRNCLKYRLPDDAQAAFLRAGGPKRDPLNLDPDGDGFACSWSPDNYRKLLQ